MLKSCSTVVGASTIAGPAHDAGHAAGRLHAEAGAEILPDVLAELSLLSFETCHRQSCFIYHCVICLRGVPD